MTLLDTAALDLACVKRAFQIGATETGQDALLTDCLNAATARLRTELGREIRRTVYTAVRFDPPAGCELYAVEWPILSVGSLSLRFFGAQTVWAPGDSGDPIDFDVEVVGHPSPTHPWTRRALRRPGGWPCGASGILLSYTAGFGSPPTPVAGDIPIPDDLVEGWLYLVADEYKKRDRSQWGIDALSINGQSVSLDQGKLLLRARELLLAHRRMAA